MIEYNHEVWHECESCGFQFDRRVYVKCPICNKTTQTHILDIYLKGQTVYQVNGVVKIKRTISVKLHMFMIMCSDYTFLN